MIVSSIFGLPSTMSFQTQKIVAPKERISERRYYAFY
jgi:hypothetical protein